MSNTVTNEGNLQRDRFGPMQTSGGNGGTARMAYAGNEGNGQWFTARVGAVTGALNKGGPW